MANNDRAAVQSGLNDILGNVIQSDRRRAGRSEEQAQSIGSDLPKMAGEIQALDKTPDTMTSVTAIPEQDNNTLTHYDSRTVKQSDNMTSKTTAKKRPEKPEIEPDPEVSALEKRIHEAQLLADSPTTTVTLRIPHALNNWLDEYVHGSWPDKVKKQQLVTEALQLLYARRGKPKDEVLTTELFPEKH